MQDDNLNAAYCPSETKVARRPILGPSWIQRAPRSKHYRPLRTCAVAPFWGKWETRTLLLAALMTHEEADTELSPPRCLPQTCLPIPRGFCSACDSAISASFIV